MRKHVALISSSLPPGGTTPVTGGGLRTQQLLSTLESTGHSVTLLVEADAFPARSRNPLKKNSFARDELAKKLASLRPDLVVVEQWALLNALGDYKGPTVVDLHGSLLLENSFRRNHGALDQDAGAKLKALRRADLMLTPAQAQIDYFTSWAILAGFDPRDPPLRLLPLASTKPPQPRSWKSSPPLSLVYGGARWPWIDSSSALRVAAKAVRRHEGARLDLFTYTPPKHGLELSTPLDPWSAVLQDLDGADRVTLHSKTDHKSYLRHLRTKATVALDLWEPNAERMLAATTRTIEFLATGLPVVTVEGSAWGAELTETGAGWVVPAGDDAALSSLLDALAADPELIINASRAATRLIEERHSLKVCGSALIDFVESPHKVHRPERSLVDQLLAEREQHLSEHYESLARSHREEHESLVASHRADTAELREHHRGETASILEEQRAELARATQAHLKAISAMKAELEEVQRGAREQHLAAVQQHKFDVESVRSDHKLQLATLRQEHKAEMERQRIEREVEVARIVARANEETDRERLERSAQAARLVEEAKVESQRIAAHWQAELKAIGEQNRDALEAQAQQHRDEIERIDEGHRAALERERSDRESEATRIVAKAEKEHDRIVAKFRQESRAEAKRIVDQWKSELTAMDEQNRAALETQAQHHRLEIEKINEGHRATLERERVDREAEAARIVTKAEKEKERIVAKSQEEVQRLVGQWQAEVRQMDDQSQAEMEAQDQRHRAEMERAVTEWQGRLDTAQQAIEPLKQRLEEAHDRLREERSRHKEELLRQEVELKSELRRLEDRLRDKDEELGRRQQTVDDLHPMTSQVPRFSLRATLLDTGIARRPRQTAHLARLWLGHIVDNERN